MSNTVDRRVVEMQFDNKDFENNVQTSVKSLDKLKKSLDLEESAKGLSAFEKAGRKFNLDGMVQAAEAVTNKFSIVGTIGDQMLRRIGDAAFNALGKMKRFVESLTIDPISTGLQEYETQINSIQTILSNTRDKMSKDGFSDSERLEIVKDRLDQLNHYADKTIYNFTEMTRNIGTFTAAGVELDTAVRSIQGIANIAAISGSTSEQANRAMYQLSQAISSGTVKLMDWNSVVNAGMGGEVFQKALQRTATAMGVTVDKTVTEVDSKGKKVKKTVKRTVGELIDEAGSFRESLSDGWLSADVLTATLEQFSWDFEQMAKDTVLDDATRESMIEKLANAYVGDDGDMEKARKRARAVIGDISNLSVDAVKEIKKADLLASGYTLEEADEIIRLAEDATEAATKVKTFTQLFDTLKEAAQSGWTQTWEYIIGDFEESKETLTGISDFFGKIIDSASEARNTIMKEWHDKGGRDMLWNNDEKKSPLGAFWNLAHGIKNVIGVIREEFQKIFSPTTAHTVLNFTKRIQEVTSKFKIWTENSNGMEKVRRIIAGIASAFGIVKDAISFVWGGFKKLIGVSKPAVGGILEFAASIGDWLVKTREAIKNSKGFQSFFEKIGTAITSVRDVAVSTFKTVATWIGKLLGKLKSSGFLTKIGQGISNFVGKIPDAIDKVKKWTKWIAEYVKTSKTLQKSWNNIKKFFEPVLDGIDGFGKRLKEALSKFFNKDVSGEEDLLGKLKARLSAFGSSFSDCFETVKSTVSDVWTKIKDFLTNFFTKTIPDFFTSIKVGTSSFISRIKSINWVDVIKTAVGIYAGFKKLSTIIAIKSVGNGLKEIGNGLKEIGKGIKNVVKNGIEITRKNKDSLGNTILKIAAAVGVLVASIYVLSKIETEDIVKGLGVITIIAIELLAVSFLFGKIGADGKSFLMVSAALTLLVIPIKRLGAMDTKQALKGIVAVGIIMTEIALFMRLAGKGFTGKTGFLGLTIAINLMVLAVKSMAKLDTGSMVKALIGMGVLLLEMSIFMKKTAGLGKIGSLIGMAVAVNLLVFAVRRMGKIDAKTITKGVLGLGGIMIAFGLMVKMTKDMKFGSSIVMLLTMAGTMILFIEAFKQVEGMDADSMLKFALSLSAIMLALSVATKIISTIPISGALAGLAKFAILIVGVGAIIAALGAIQNEWKGMTGLLESGGNVLGLIGHALGKFVGGIGAGIVEGVNLPQLGTDLSDFMKNASDFIEGAKNIDGGTVEGIGHLCAAILAISGTEFVSALVSLTVLMKENPVKKFSEDIKILGEGLSNYALSVLPMALVPKSLLDRSVAVASALAEVASNIPATGGIISLLTGVRNLGTFGDDLETLGGGLCRFASKVSEIDNDKFNQTKIDAVISIATGLSELERNLEGQGGFEDAINGVKSLSLFSSGTKPFAEGLNDFIVKASGIVYDPNVDGKKIDDVISIAIKLSELERNLEGQGGFEDAINGVKSLSLFGSDLPDFATGVNNFIDQVKEIKYDSKKDENRFDAVIAVAQSLSDFEKTLEGQGGFEDWISGSQNLGDFGNGIGLLGVGLRTFSDSIGGVSYEKTDDAISVLDLIKEFTGGLDKTGSVFQSIGEFFGGSSENTLLSQTENMVTVGERLRTFSDSIGGVSYEKTDDAISVLDLIKEFTGGLDESGGILDSIGKFFGGSSENTLLSQTENMVTVSSNLSTFASNLSGTDFSNTKTATDVVKYFQSFIDSFEKSGGLFASIGEFFGGSKDIVGLSEKMASFGNDFKIFSSGIETAKPASENYEYVRTVIEAFGSLNAAVKKGEIDVYYIEQVAWTIGYAFTDSLAEAIEVGADKVESATVTLSNAGSDSASNAYSIWFSTGNRLGEGLASGISSMAEKVREAAVSTAEGAIRAIQITWSVCSPSRVGRDLGMNFDLGIAGGLSAYSKVVSGQAMDVGQQVVKSASTMLFGTYGSIFDNIDPNPTIRPVLDLTSIESGLGRMNGMFSSGMPEVGLFRGMTFKKNVNEIGLDSSRITNGLFDRNIVNKLDELQKEITGLNVAVTNMKIVLDTGELVGATSWQIDNQLGTLAMRRGRGN